MRYTLIAWADDTQNLWWGCVGVNAQCDRCYAESWDKRMGDGISHWGARAPRMIVNSVWKSLEDAQKLAAREGKYRTQFVQSMSDIFERAMPLVDRQGNEIADMSTADLRNRLF